MPDKAKRILKAVGKELKEKPPHVLAITLRKKGPAAAGRQRVAILLAKARSRGARIPLPEGAGGVDLANADNPNTDKQGIELMKEVGAL